VSCFACKTRDGKSYGKCAMKDSLTPVLKRPAKPISFFVGSPIYFGTVTGETRFLHGAPFFPYMTYTDPPGSLFSRKILTGLICTMNAPEETARERGFDRAIAMTEMVMRMVFGVCESLVSYDTYQFEDYSKIVAPRFDPEKKARRRAEVFPADCQKAFDMGARFVGELW